MNGVYDHTNLFHIQKIMQIKNKFSKILSNVSVCLVQVHKKSNFSTKQILINESSTKVLVGKVIPFSRLSFPCPILAICHPNDESLLSSDYTLRYDLLLKALKVMFERT